MNRNVKTLLYLLVMLTMAACLPSSVPTSVPRIDVVVTVVPEDQLGEAVAAALTGTASSDTAATERALATAGVSLTPSPTSTLTPTPLPPTETPFLSPTPTITPTATSTPTATPYPSNTPNTLANASVGQIRVINGLRGEEPVPVDVFIDQLPVALDLGTGEVTAYYGVDRAETVRLTLIPPALRSFNALTGEEIVTQLPPLVDQLIEVPRGSSITSILVDLMGTPELLLVTEDVSPLQTGHSRLTLVQANPDLIRVNIQDVIREMTLVYDQEAGEISGPFDLLAGDMALQFVDASFPDQVVIPPNSLKLETNVNHLVVVIPSLDPPTENFASDILVFQSGTQITLPDVPMRFVNAAPAAGPLTIRFQGVELVRELPVGEITVALPVSQNLGRLVVLDSNNAPILQQVLDVSDESESRNERIVLISDLPEEEIDRTIVNPTTVQATSFTRDPLPSQALANIRLIHGLTGATQTLDLEMRATDPRQIDNPIGVPQPSEADLNWSRTVRGVSFGEASTYVSRASNVFDMRVVLSSTGAVQATANRLPLLPGGAYDVLIVPGPGAGVARLLVIEPNPQVSIIGGRQGDPEVVEAIVGATLTAAAPDVTVTLVAERSPTPTISPVPTNTPRPTSTPRVQPPALVVNPAPPNTVSGALIVFGQNFAPNTRYTVNLDREPVLLSGLVDPNGEIALTVDLPPGTAPGPHVVRVCGDCRPNGAQQEALAAFIVADPNVTLTPTAQP